MKAHMGRPKEVMMGREDPVEATLVGSPGHRLRELERLAAIPLAGIERADVDTEPHREPLEARSECQTFEVADNTRSGPATPRARSNWSTRRPTKRRLAACQAEGQ